MFSSTARNTYVLFTGNTLDAFFAFLFTVFTFRLLSKGDFGIFSAINNTVVLVFSILDIGIGSSVINFISYHKHRGENQKAREYFKAGLLLRAIFSAIASTLIIIFSWIIAPKAFLTHEYSAVMLAGVAIFGLSLLDIITFSLQAYQKFLYSALSSTSFSFSRVALIFLVMTLKLPYSITIAMFITALAPLVGTLMGIKFLKLSLNESRPSSEIYKSLISFGGWVGVNKIASSIAGRLDVQMLLLLAGPVDTGNYSVAARITSFYSVIITSFSSVLAPKLSSGKKPAEIHSFFGKSILAITGLLFCMIIAIFIAKPFILTLFGQKAIDSIVPFQGLTLAMMPFVANSLAITVIIFYLKTPKVVGILAIIQAICVFAGNMLLIPKLKIFGPIVTLGVTHTLIFVISTIIIVKNFNQNDSKT